MITSATFVKQHDHKTRRIYANNKVGLKGVSWNKQRRKYVAQLQVNGKGIFLGYFDNPIRAATWYHAFAQLAFGEYARAV
jgi:hypothetical protein